MGREKMPPKDLWPGKDGRAVLTNMLTTVIIESNLH